MAHASPVRPSALLSMNSDILTVYLLDTSLSLTCWGVSPTGSTGSPNQELVLSEMSSIAVLDFYILSW